GVFRELPRARNAGTPRGPGPGVIDDMGMTETTAAPPLPCGTWASPITASDVAQQQRQVCFPLAIDGEAWWQELLADEQGRTTVVRLGADGQRKSMLPATSSAGTTVHDDAARSYLPLAD